MTRPELVSIVDQGAELSQLFVTHHRRLVGLAALLVDDRASAEEVVQDTFLALHRKGGSFGIRARPSRI